MFVMEAQSGSEGDLFELWSEETVDIKTPFSHLVQNDTEYMKLEIAELKQLLISLAQKYKLSEDRRKVAEKRNAILKTDNERLQQISDDNLSQKIEAEIENRKTLDKLREFMDFRAEFEKQAELLKKIIGHLPKMKNASTTTRVEVEEKCEQTSFTLCDGNQQTDDELNNTIRDGNHQTDDLIFDNTNFIGSGDNNEQRAHRLSDTYQQFDVRKSEIENQNEWMKDELNDEEVKDIGDVEEDENNMNYNNRVEKEKANESKMDWHHENRQCKSKVKLARLKQELIALKNLNEWKTSDLDYKNMQLIVKNRELMCARKEMNDLKMKINKLLVEQRKRYYKPFLDNKELNNGTSNIKPAQVLKDKKIKDQTNKKDNKTDRRCKELKSEYKTNDQNENLAVSREQVWKEIAPGDQIKIKIKKHSVSEGNLDKLFDPKELNEKAYGDVNLQQ